MVVIRISSKFERQYKKLSGNIKYAAKAKENIFRTNPFDPRLDTHKLHGKDKEAWSFSITHSYRIKFNFLAKRGILFLEIGIHDIYK